MSLPDDVEDRRSMLRVLLLITISTAIFFSIFNWSVGLKLFSLMEFVIACFWLGILSISKTTHNVHRWSIVYLVTFLSLVLIGIWVSKFRAGLYAWILIFPILSYLLLGRRLGVVFTTVSVFLGFGVLGWRVWQQNIDQHWIVLGNFGLCALAIWVMAHVYECKREAVVSRLHKMATQDPLTGLLNSRTLVETLTHVLHSAKRRLEPVTFAYIDINDFKLINDLQGHYRGDQVLLTVVQAMKSVTRLDDFLFRFGGDEFLIVFSNCTETQARDIYACRISEEIKKCGEALTLSIGFVQADPKNELSPEELIRQADHNMYTAKRAEKLKSVTPN